MIPKRLSQCGVILLPILLKLFPKYDFIISIPYHAGSRVVVKLSELVIMMTLFILSAICIVHFLNRKPMRRIIDQLLWRIIKRIFQAAVFFLQFLWCVTIIGRSLLLQNPNWDYTVYEAVKLSDVALAIIWVLICVLSSISIVNMGYIIRFHQPQPRPRPAPLRVILFTLWLVIMLIGTFVYFITINWYVWLSWTSNLDSKNQFYQIFPATFLMVHGFIQILFIRRRDYNIESFIGFSNMSFNLVMVVHLCTLCKDGLTVDSSGLVLPAAIAVSSPFELAHRTIALIVFVPNIMALRLVFFYRYLIQMIIPHRNQPPVLSRAVLETPRLSRNELVMKNHDSIPMIETLGRSIHDHLITTPRPRPSYEVVIADIIPYSSDLLSGMVLKRYQSELPYQSDTSPGYVMSDPKPPQLHNPKGGGVYFSGCVPDYPCEHVTLEDCTEGYCLNEASGGGGVVCTGKDHYVPRKGLVPGTKL